MIQHFLEYLKIEKHYSRLTILAYESDLINFCQFLGVEPDNFDINLCSEDDVRQWMMWQLRNKLNSRTVNRRLSSLHSLCKYLLRIGAIEKDITHNIISPKIKKPLPSFYKESEMENAFLEENTADDYISKRDNLLLEMLYQTGMRSAEITRLKDEDVSLSNRQIRVFGKRSKERIVPIGDKLAAMIEDYRLCREETFTDFPTQTMWLSAKGKTMTQYQLYTVVHSRMSEVSTQKKQSPHVLRHTFATTMLNNGADINTIKELLGHANLAATEIYTHTTFEQIQKAYNKAHPRAKKQ